jgi:hypothetical protein
VERFHRKLIECFGSWHCGIELAVGLLAEFLHRHNQDQAVLNVPEYRNEYHVDLWLIDRHQILALALFGEGSHA